MGGFNVSLYNRRGFKDNLHLIPGLTLPWRNFPRRTCLKVVLTKGGVEKGWDISHLGQNYIKDKTLPNVKFSSVAFLPFLVEWFLFSQFMSVSRANLLPKSVKSEKKS